MVKHPLWRMGALGLLPDSAPGGTDLQIAADKLTQWFGTHAPTTGQVAEVANFQLAWNAHPIEGSGITVDGEYGGNSEAAYGITLAHYNMGTDAFPNAFGDAVPAVPSTTPAGKAPPKVPGVTPAATTPSAPLVEKDDSTGWILPVAVGAAVVGGLVLLFKKKRGGSHARRSAPMLTVRTNPMRRCL